MWLTAESLGDSDPALMAYPDLPAVFVFDEPLLQRLQLSAKRLVFLTETLAEIATQTQLSILVGDPVAVLGEGRSTRPGCRKLTRRTPGSYLRAGARIPLQGGSDSSCRRAPVAVVGSARPGVSFVVQRLA